MHEVIWHIWYELGQQVQILKNGHDAVLFQYPSELDVIESIIEVATLTKQIKGRSLPR